MCRPCTVLGGLQSLTRHSRGGNTIHVYRLGVPIRRFAISEHGITINERGNEISVRQSCAVERGSPSMYTETRYL